MWTEVFVQILWVVESCIEITELVREKLEEKQQKPVYLGNYEQIVIVTSPKRESASMKNNNRLFFIGAMDPKLAFFITNPQAF